MDDIERLASDLVFVFGPPRWKFWKRRLTKLQAVLAIEHALVGEATPIQVFGVAMPTSARTRSERWTAIRQQIHWLRKR